MVECTDDAPARWLDGLYFNVLLRCSNVLWSEGESVCASMGTSVLSSQFSLSELRICRAC